MINRKNFLVLLGALVISGGIVLGTGAFSTVEADRTVTIDTAGDSSALLGLQVNGTYNGLSNTSTDGTIQLGISDLNENAVTTFDDAVTVTNSGSQTVYLSVDTESGSGLTFTDSAGNDLTANEVEITAGNSEPVSLEVDTTGSFSSSSTVTFKANSTAQP